MRSTGRADWAPPSGCCSHLVMSAVDPGCVKTPENRKPGETFSQIARNLPRSETVVTLMASEKTFVLSIFRAAAFSHNQGRVEERRGCLGHAATLRFLSPLIE